MEEEAAAAAAAARIEAMARSEVESAEEGGAQGQRRAADPNFLVGPATLYSIPPSLSV